MLNPQEWCISKHRDTNHFYDTYLPYEFHLRMVAQACKDFEGLLQQNEVQDCRIACWGHDLIEDCRVSYNDVKQRFGVGVAEIIYAVTNEKGKNRAERGNEKYYQGIRSNERAIFVKLCDRIANVQYSSMTKSRMYGMYKEEHDKFCQLIGRGQEGKRFETMFSYLDQLFGLYE